MYDNEYFSDMQPDFTKQPEDMPTGLTSEEQVQWLQNENQQLRKDFNRLCDIVADIQYTLTRMMQYSESRINDLEWSLQRHTNKFHAMLIISPEKKEGESDENNIS